MKPLALRGDHAPGGVAGVCDFAAGIQERAAAEIVALHAFNLRIEKREEFPARVESRLDQPRLEGRPDGIAPPFEARLAASSTIAITFVPVLNAHTRLSVMTLYFSIGVWTSLLMVLLEGTAFPI